MCLILNIESSAQNSSVNITQDGKTIHQLIGNDKVGLSLEITILIKKLLDKENIKIKSLQAIGISLGPGSYTSLRIGMSVAKGICFGSNIPLIGIPTLELFALYAIEKQNHQRGYYISMIDARRMDAYVSVYNEAGEVILPASFVTLTELWFEQWKTKNIIVVGNGVEKITALNNVENVIIINESNPTVEIMSKPSYEYYKRRKFIDVAYCVPYYLKPPNITKSKNIL